MHAVESVKDWNTIRRRVYTDDIAASSDSAANMWPMTDVLSDNALTVGLCIICKRIKIMTNGEWWPTYPIPPSPIQSIISYETVTEYGFSQITEMIADSDRWWTSIPITDLPSLQVSSKLELTSTISRSIITVHAFVNAQVAYTHQHAINKNILNKHVVR